MKGSMTARSERITAPAVSPVLTTGLPNPPVATLLWARSSAMPPLASPAMPPPAMMAGHRTPGGMSAITEALTMMPAAIAAGVASTSSRWSTPGM